LIRCKIGIVELLKAPASGPATLVAGWPVRRQRAALMPQAVPVWCRRLGHRVHCATDWGVGDPRRRLNEREVRGWAPTVWPTSTAPSTRVKSVPSPISRCLRAPAT